MIAGNIHHLLEETVARNMKWLVDVAVSYIIDCYAGTEPSPNNPHMERRVFEWQENGAVVRGNTEAFCLHLGRKFEREAETRDAQYIHNILRKLGEPIRTFDERSSPSATSPNVGRFRQPEPQERVLRRA